METFNETHLKTAAHSVINQNGKGMDIDRYIYSMQGEGLGSFFGNIVKSALPMLGKAIKGAAKIAKPHMIAVGNDLLAAGSKRGIDAINKKLIHKPHKKQKQNGKVFKF